MLNWLYFIQFFFLFVNLNSQICPWLLALCMLCFVASFLSTSLLPFGFCVWASAIGLNSIDGNIDKIQPIEWNVLNKKRSIKIGFSLMDIFQTLGVFQYGVIITMALQNIKTWNVTDYPMEKFIKMVTCEKEYIV